MAKLRLGLQHAEELDPITRMELEQLIAAVQAFAGAYLDVEGENTGDQTISLSGDVSGSGTGAIATTIANDAVTYAKMQNVSAASRLLGRGSAAGAGDPQEISLGSGLSMSSTTLNASGSGSLPSSAQGDIFYASATDTVTVLNKNTTATRYLANTGTNNNPAWNQVNVANGVTGDLPFANLTQIAGLSVLGVTGSSTADVAAITAGTDGHVLTRVSSSSLAFAAPASSGALVLLEQHTASTSASLDFTTCITSTYDEYLVELIQLVPATSGANPLWRVSTNGGSSYVGTTDYKFAAFRSSKAGSASAGSSGFTGIQLDGAGGPTNSTTTGGLNGSMRIFNPLSGSIHTRVTYQTGIDDGTANESVVVMGSGAYAQTTAVNAFQIIMSSGNITSGTVRVYGIAK